MHRSALSLLLFFFAALLAACSSTIGVVEPFDFDTPLPTDRPESVGFDPSRLEEMARRIEAEPDHELHGLLIARHGRVVFEKYYHGFDRDTPHDLRSATKSLTSLLVGAAIDRGHLDNVDQPVMTALAAAYPQVRDKHDITLRHLLTMSSGLDCNDRDRASRGQEDRMYRKRDWLAHFLSLERIHPPGTHTAYCTGGVVALGEVIASSSGTDFADFADRALFRPLGIRNYRWARYDRGSKVDSGGHLLLTPQGLAKIGMLVLQGGRWQEEQLVPESWIRLSTREQTRSDGVPYGFLWWLHALPYADRTIETVTAQGNGGQTLVMIPELDLLMVSTAGYYNSEKARLPFDLLHRAIVPALSELGLG